MATFLILILTGYLLYYAGDDQPRAMISLLHWVIGLGAPLAYAVHRLWGRFIATRSSAAG